jgi:hypothetical protein
MGSPDGDIVIMRCNMREEAKNSTEIADRNLWFLKGH